jgi:hypothetical protein
MVVGCGDVSRCRSRDSFCAESWRMVDGVSLIRCLHQGPAEELVDVLTLCVCIVSTIIGISKLRNLQIEAAYIT